jgi:hypothetical protein
MHRIKTKLLLCLLLVAGVAGAFLAFKPRPVLDPERIAAIEILCPHKHRVIIAKIAEDEIKLLRRWVDRNGKDRSVVGGSFRVAVTDMKGDRFDCQMSVDSGFWAIRISPHQSLLGSALGEEPAYFSFRHSSGVLYDKLESLRKAVSNCDD